MGTKYNREEMRKHCHRTVGMSLLDTVERYFLIIIKLCHLSRVIRKHHKFRRMIFTMKLKNTSRPHHKNTDVQSTFYNVTSSLGSLYLTKYS